MNNSTWKKLFRTTSCEENTYWIASGTIHTLHPDALQLPIFSSSPEVKHFPTFLAFQHARIHTGLWSQVHKKWDWEYLCSIIHFPCVPVCIMVHGSSIKDPMEHRTALLLPARQWKCLGVIVSLHFVDSILSNIMFPTLQSTAANGRWSLDVRSD